MPCLYATTIMAHSRAHLAFAALSTERTSAGSRWVIDDLDCLRVFGAAGIWFPSKCNITCNAGFEFGSVKPFVCVPGFRENATQWSVWCIILA